MKPAGRSRSAAPSPAETPAPTRPFVKWAGGKTQLLGQFAPLYPPASLVSRYVEPFAGSGAVFFHVREMLAPRAVVLADGNRDLMEAYEVVRDDVEALIRALRRHRERHSADHYYKVRAQAPRRMTRVARAARLIYLNKTCFNGLYRVNARGEFNVPMGRYENPPILDAENLRAASSALRDVELRAGHFRETLGYARRGDFIYFDPPYQPLSKTSFFTAYTDGSFRESDQAELAEVFGVLAARGSLVMLSNSDTPLVRDLYREYDIRPVRARRSINSRADRRGRIGEVVVLNYQPRDRSLPLRGDEAGGKSL